MGINKELLDILMCPACRGNVVQKDNQIVCTSCRRMYPIRDEIPIMLINEAVLPEGSSPQETKTS